MSAEPTASCDHTATPDWPAATQCSNCPARLCEQCGQNDHPTSPCSCWTPLDGMAFADLKALFAAERLDVIR